jgi:hypothetical protein
VLGPGDPLLHGGLAHHEGAGDLLDGQAADDAQGHRDLLGGRQVGVAADEQQPEDVIAVLPAVEALGQLRLLVVQVRELLVGGQGPFLVAPAHAIEGRVPPHEDQPGGRIAGRAVLRPVLQCPQTGLLERLLGGVEVAEVAQERPHRPRAGGPQRQVDPGQLGHLVVVPGLKMEMGRIS